MRKSKRTGSSPFKLKACRNKLLTPTLDPLLVVMPRESGASSNPLSSIENDQSTVRWLLDRPVQGHPVVRPSRQTSD